MLDEWDHFGPKRKQLLDTSWAGVFRTFLFEELPIREIRARFHPSMGRPSKELFAMCGTLLLQQLHDFTDPQTEEAQTKLQAVAEDVLRLVERFREHASVSRLESFGLLRRVLEEQCKVVGGESDPKVVLKDPKEISANSLQNPHDPEAGYDGHKGQGYQAQIQETYHEKAEGETDEFKEKFKSRSGIEATNSHLKRDLKMKRLRVRGLANVRFVVTLKIMGLNLMRATRVKKARLLSGFHSQSLRLPGHALQHFRILSPTVGSHGSLREEMDFGQNRLLNFLPGRQFIYTYENLYTTFSTFMGLHPSLAKI